MASRIILNIDYTSSGYFILFFGAVQETRTHAPHTLHVPSQQSNSLGRIDSTLI